MNLDTKLYFSSINYNGYYNEFWDSCQDTSEDGGRFFVNIAKRINPCRFVSRNGEWSLPWKQEIIPGFEMPEYVAGFSKSFAEVCDNRALEVKARIINGEKFAVLFSGGIDSTTVMVALLKNLTKEELSNVVICSSTDTLIEHPTFWKKYIMGNFRILDSSKNKYDDLIEAGYTPITADEGDCIFGTVLGITMYANYDYYLTELSPETQLILKNLKYGISDSSIHFSVYKDMIIRHLSLNGDREFGRLLYEKYAHNVATATVPVHSLHDFFWWLIFNVKYLNCAVRSSIYYNDRVEWQTCIRRVFNWYGGKEIQQWSMANNNNGQKIRKTMSSYKQAAKDYIWEFDKNDWYRNFKIKIDSMWTITVRQDVSKVAMDRRPVSRVALTDQYEMWYLGDREVQDFFRANLANYKIDWA